MPKPKTKPSANRPASSVPDAQRVLTGQALLDDMRAFKVKVASSKESATKFLQQMGVLTPDGKTKRLIRR